MKRLALLACVWSCLSWAQQDLSKVEIKTVPVKDNINMLVGAGGNIGVFHGEDGVFLIDDQFAPLTDKIVSAVKAIDDGPIRYVINTHWHFDHTGGNENIGKMGTVIVAHRNVRKRMSEEGFIKALNMRFEPSPDVALPSITFTRDISFHINGEEVYVFHIRNAHTDGDAVVYFRDSNVIHMGDLFFSGNYPFIDTSSGGSINGMIAAVEQVIDMVDGDTKLIPGHGPLSGRTELMAYLKMLRQVRDSIGRMVDMDKTREEVLAANPLAKLNEKWGGGFMNAETFTGIVYDDLVRFK